MSANGPVKLPWESALYAAVQKQDAQLAQCKAERARLQARVTDLTHRLENWQLRREAWARERADLLQKIKELSS